MIHDSLTPADELLEQWPHLRKSQRVAKFEGLPLEYMDNFFLDLDANAQCELVLALPEGERRLCIRLLAPDDAADLIQHSPQREREYLFGLLDDMTRVDAKALLDYREDSTPFCLSVMGPSRHAGTRARPISSFRGRVFMD